MTKVSKLQKSFLDILLPKISESRKILFMQISIVSYNGMGKQRINIETNIDRY